ncbi:MAG TPA: bifunctional aldolase/short-chain dehydrogenase [Acidimicrobiia bacterium]
MQDRWDPSLTFDDPLDECVYGSRLIGSDPFLVLHGGGNTSVKAPWVDVTGDEVEALYVKGSGWDLGTIEAAGFAPLPLARLRRLLELEALSDPDMMASLSAARLDPSAPQPSVESLLHAILPHRAVLHSHADVIVTLTNLADGEARVREALGDDVVIVPYVMPGFDLARVVAQMWPEQGRSDTSGMVLMNHGLFTFGDTTREAYARHVDLITRAEEYLDRHAPLAASADAELEDVDPVELAQLRRQISDAAGAPMIVSRHRDPAVARFVARPDLESLANRGPLTPDHIIRTKRTPLVGTDVDSFVSEYQAYFERNKSRSDFALTMLDPAPRVVLDPRLGMLTVGRRPADADIAADIYHHTIPVLERAEDHFGGYVALGEGELFDVEYWDLEQAKLRRAGSPPPMAGRVAVVTGAASGIGRACAAELLSRGAAVIGIDISADVTGTFQDPAWLGVSADVTDSDAVAEALSTGVERFGGVDMAVLAAGIFGSTRPVAELDPDEWRRVHAVNVDSAAHLLARLHPLLTVSPAHPSVVVIASRNVLAPGKGAAAYSASKAALTQLARVTALEWAEDGIRVNIVHPDAVFDTGLWTPELLAERASKYGLTVDEYKRRNLLSVEVTSATVAGVVGDLLSERFAATTGAQIPIDGGSERVI